MLPGAYYYNTLRAVKNIEVFNSSFWCARRVLHFSRRYQRNRGLLRGFPPRISLSFFGGRFTVSSPPKIAISAAETAEATVIAVANEKVNGPEGERRIMGISHPPAWSLTVPSVMRKPRFVADACQIVPGEPKRYPIISPAAAKAFSGDFRIIPVPMSESYSVRSLPMRKNVDRLKNRQNS